MRRPEFRYDFTIDGHQSTGTSRSQSSRGVKRLSDYDFRNRAIHAQLLMGGVGDEEIWAQDLWRVARAVYLADRRSPRRQTADGWTRMIELSAQVHEPARWEQSHLDELNVLLQVLTGDRWDIHVYGGLSITRTFPEEPWATHVALFSGGLDSTAYAADSAARLGPDDRILFVAYDASVKGRQQRVFDDIENLAPKRVRLQSASVRPYGKALDTSNRSRSFLFITTAVCLAAIHGVRTVAVPENGQLAINPALTPGRRSACSTRSVHPWVLHNLNRIIDGLGGNVTVTNPFLHLTKGEVCECALESAGLTIETLERTVSCGHPTTAPRPYYHCGHCFPCLVRRSGLHKILNGRPDRSGYAVDPPDIDLTDTSTVSRDRAADLRDLIRWLHSDFTVDDLIADAPFPSQIPPHTVMPVLQRGRHELGSMLDELIPETYDAVRSASGTVYSK